MAVSLDVPDREAPSPLLVPPPDRAMDDPVSRKSPGAAGVKGLPMRTRPPRTVAGLALLHLAAAGLVAVSAVLQADPGEKPDESVATDKAVLELLDVPARAKVFLDDREQGKECCFELGPFRAGEWKTYQLRVELPDVQEPFTRKLLLRGGWHVRVPVRAQTPSSRPQVVVQTGHTGRVTSVAYSRDGSRVVTGSQDQTAILWDAKSGRKLCVLEGHKGAVRAVAFSPDGGQVLTGSDDKTAILWDANSGRPLCIYAAHKGAVTSVAFSPPDGRQILTGSADKTAVLWDKAKCKACRLPFAGHEGAVNAVAFSPEGKSVLTGSDDRTARLWDVADDTQRPRKFEGHTEGIYALAFNPKGRQAVTASHDGTAILWDLDKGRADRSFAHGGWVNAVAFSPDGKSVLTGGDDKTARLWDVATGQPAGLVLTPGSEVKAVAFSPDGRQLLTGGEDKTAALWDRATGTKLPGFQGYQWLVDAVTFSSDGRQLLAGSGDGRVILWDAAEGRQPRVLSGRTGRASAVALSPDGRQVVTGCDDGTAVLWDAAADRKVKTFERHADWVQAVAFSPDGSQVLTGSGDKKAILWDVASGGKVQTFAGHKQLVSAVAFGPKGRQVLTGSWDKTAIVWDVASGNPVRVLDARPYQVLAVAFSPDGGRVLAGLENRTAILWDAAGGWKPRVLKGHKGWVKSVAFSPDGNLALTGSDDGTAIAWDAASGGELQRFEGHTKEVRTAGFSPDGRQVFTGSLDGTVRLWDLAGGEELARLLSLEGGGDWLVVTPEGLFDGTADGEQKVAFRTGAGLDVRPVEYFFDKFNRAGLLAAIWHGDRPMPSLDLGKSLPPDVRIVSPPPGDVADTDEVTVVVECRNKGGGVGEVKLKQNDVNVGRPNSEERNGELVKSTFIFQLVEGPNRLEASAVPTDGASENHSLPVVLRYLKPPVKPDLYLLTVGVNHYTKESMNLNFAAPDARAMDEVFERRGKSLYADVHPHVLLDEQATRAGIHQALVNIAKDAKKRDTLIVFLSGHGTMVGDLYYFIPSDFRPAGDNSLEDDVRKQGLAANVLTQDLEQVPALKKILVLDTCHSGGMLGPNKGGKDPFAFRGTIERLGRAEGTCIIAAAAASEEAKEVPELKHGVLAYTLLAGLGAVDDGPLKVDHVHPDNAEGVVDVLEWFHFASLHVPDLMNKYFGREQDVQPKTTGDFPVLPLDKSRKLAN
jgi:WD40 repeat protein